MQFHVVISLPAVCWSYYRRVSEPSGSHHRQEVVAMWLVEAYPEQVEPVAVFAPVAVASTAAAAVVAVFVQVAARDSFAADSRTAGNSAVASCRSPEVVGTADAAADFEPASLQQIAVVPQY